jgi:hypothetical protein
MECQPFLSDVSIIGCSFKFLLKVGFEELIVNAPRITDKLFKSNLTFSVCVFTLVVRSQSTLQRQL